MTEDQLVALGRSSDLAKRVFKVAATLFGVGSLYFWWRLFDAGRLARDPNTPILERPVYEGWITQAATYGVLCLLFALACLLTSRQATKLDMFLFPVVWGGALVVAAGATYLFSIPFWVSAAIVTVAWFANGVVAAIEDRSLWGRTKKGES